MFRRNSLMTRIISAVLSVGMVWSMSPTSVLAENAVSQNASAAQTESTQTQSDTTKPQEKTPATIVLDANGGAGTMEDVQIADSSNFDQKLAQNVYKRDGYLFMGWSTTANNKDAKNAAGRVVTPAIAVPDAADIANWKFLWDANDDGTADPATETFDLSSCVKDGKLTLYAQWARITTTVHFDGNGATSGTMDDEVMPQDTDTALTANAFARDGYKFTGWSTTKDNQSSKDDPATAADESFLATFLGDQVHFLKNVASYDSDGDGAAESFDMNYAAAADPKNAANSTITLYAQWEKLPEQSTSENADANQNKSAEAAEDSEQKSNEGQNASAEQNAASDSSSETTDSENQNADDEAAESSDTKEESSADANADSSNGSGLVAESDEDHLKNAAPAESTADDKQADVRDADHGGADDLTVKVQDTSTATSLVQSLSMLFAAPAKESDAAPADNPSQDGESIKELSVKWLTPGTVSASDSTLTVFKPSDNSSQTAKASVYISLDSSKSYKAGSVRLVIPGHIFAKRDASRAGNLVLPAVENPGTKTQFNWSYDANNDTYTLTSTRDIQGRSEITIEMGFENLTPSDLVDMQSSSEFVAKAYVTNSKGNLLTKTSNSIKAAFDTQETLKTAELAPNDDGNGICWETKVPASRIPADKRIDGVDKYLVVTYKTRAFHTGNTAYELGWDTANQDFGAYDGKGNKVADGVVIYNGTGTDTSDSWSRDDNTSWHLIRVAYDFSKFTVDTDYTLKAGIKWSLTETDNKGQITAKDAQTTVKFAWHNPTEVPAGGHYAHMNWGDDNDDAFTIHVQIYGTRYDYSNRNFRIADLLRGYYGIYRSALNDLADGSDATVRYQKYLRGYMLPAELAQGGDTTKKASFSNPVRMVVEDGDYSIAENAGAPQYEGLQVGTDYDITSLLVCKPTSVYKAAEVDASDLQPGQYLYENGTDQPYQYSPGQKVLGGTYGVAYEKTEDLNYYPKSVVEAEVNGQWQNVDTVDWKTASSDKVEVKLPAGTERWRVTVASNSIAQQGEQAAAVDTQFVCPTVVLHPTDKVKTLAASAIKDMTSPECLLQSSDSFNAYNSSDAVVYNTNENGVDHLFGYNSNIMAVPSASGNKGSWDETKTKIPVTFSGKVQEQSSVLDKDTWEEAAKKGKIQTEKSGTWYDLLPKGVVADLSTIKLRDGDSITDTYTIENYKESGRTLLVVKAQLSGDPIYQDRNKVTYVEDDPSITFNATYSMSSYLDYGQSLHNVVVFESDNNTLGNVEHFIGQPDDPTKASSDDVTVTNDITDEEKTILTNLDPSTDKAAFTYAGATVNIGAYTITNAGFDKQVDVNNEYDYGYGTTDGEKDAYLGGFYNYRLSFVAGKGKFEGLVMYDRLENPRDGIIPSGAASWKGKLLSIDTSMLKSMGIEPVIYYSTTPNLQLATMASDAEEGTAAAQANLSDTSVWSTTAPSDLSTVTAIAIDCSKKADGSAFVLEAGQSIAATLSMRAPSDASKESARAYNDAYFVSQVENAGHVDDAVMTHKGHTEVALKPFKLHLTSTWNDDNDRDGVRPTGKVVLHLYANGEAAKDANGKEITFTIDPAAASDGHVMSQDADEIIDSLPIADASGNAIHYTATLTNENGSAIDRYTQSVKYGKDKDGNTELALSQNHTPAMTSVAGTKTWSGDTDDIRPVAININLLANGKQKQTKQITESSSGDWTYSFQNLPKYENHGKEIAYSISEKGAEDYAVTVVPTAAGYDLENAYHPYGDLTVSKNVTNGTDKTANQKFTFHVSLTKQDGSDYSDSVSYKKSDGTTGTLMSGATFQLAAGESLVLEELPKGTSWKVTEENVSGYTADASEKSGTIKPNAANNAAFTNDYKTTADKSLQAQKTLDGRPIQYGQFTFELRDASGNLVRTASNDEKGAVSFGALHYTNADSGKTYTYTITEKNLAHSGYAYDSAAYEAVVTPTDKGDGTMSAAVKYYKMEDGKRGEEVAMPTFANTYRANGNVTLTAYKQLKGRDLSDKEFTFDLHAVDVAAGTDVIIATAQNDASGKIDFTADAAAEYMKRNGIANAKGLAYTQDDRDKTYVYYVSEERGADDTVNYSDEMFAWTVAVQDDGDGHMSETTTNVDASNLVNDGKVNTSWAAQSTKTLPTFTNTLKDGSLSIEKDAENAPDGDQTPFTFDVELKDSDGRPIDTESVQYEVEDVNNSNSSASSNTNSSSDTSTSSASNSTGIAASSNSNPVSNTLNSLASLLQPTSAYAADADSADKTYTITYDANGGKFADGSTQNKVTYTKHEATTMKYSHTDNIDDNGVANGTYANSLSKTDIVTIAGAKHLTIDVWYSTESTSYDWLAIYPAGVAPSSSNYSQASISNGKLGDGRATTKDAATHKQFTVDGDTAQFYFKSDGSGQYYGYYAVVSDRGISISNGTYNEPSEDGKFFQGWYADAECTQKIDNPAKLGKDATVYADMSRYQYEGTWGTCHWGITKDGCLEIGAGTGARTDHSPESGSDKQYTTPWDSYSEKIKSVRAIGKVVLPESIRDLFCNCSNLQSINFENFDSSNVTDMDSMFYGCKSLNTISLVGLDTSKVQNMQEMFYGCENLAVVTMSGLDTSKVQNMYAMFALCSNLKSIDMNGIDTHNVTNMGSMFFDCENLASLDVSGFDTKQVTNLDSMFAYCKSLTSLDVTNFDTSNATDIGGMFGYCSGLTSLDVTHFNTGKVINMFGMFVGCTNLVSLDVTSFDTHSAASMGRMFKDCSKIATLDVSAFDTSNVTDMSCMFEGCSGLNEIDVSKFDTRKVVDLSSMFQNCTGLKSLNLSNFYTGEVKQVDAGFMFMGCTNLETLDISNMQNAFTQQMFDNTPKLSYINLGRFRFSTSYNDHYATLDSPSGENTTGKWAFVGNPAISVSSDTLVQNYPSDSVPEGAYAWQLKDSVKLSFDSNGGSGQMADYVVSCSAAILPDSGFYYKDHDFTGWNTKADGTGTSYQPGDIYRIGSENTTLYAQWKNSSHTVKVTNGLFTVTIKAGQKITIKNLPGGATYTVKEHNRAGWVLDSSTGATGKIPALGVASSIFKNVYNPKATSIDISATKMLDGKTPKDGASYSFMMKANTVGAPMPNGATEATATASNVGALVDFGHIVFAKPGTYIYTITETAGTDTTINYDAHTIKARVDVSDPMGTGALVARVNYSPNDVFTNTTKPGSLTITKNVVGIESYQAFNFEIKLHDATGNPVSGTFGDVVITNGSGNISLTNGEQKKLENIPAGTYYEVNETDIPEGYSSTSTGAMGRIAAAGASTAEFTNTYKAKPINIYLSAKKVLEGRDLVADEFTFELKKVTQDQDSGGIVVDAIPVETATNNKDGSIDFNALNLDAGVYYYIIDEKAGSDESIAYSSEEYLVAIGVGPEYGGYITYIYKFDPTTSNVTEQASEAVFTNTVKTGSVSLTKTVESSEAAGKEFAFDVSLKDSSGKALDGEYTWTSSRTSADGKATTGTVKNGDAINLQKDETVTIAGLPAGSKYEFTEEDASGYTQSASSNLSGTIVADQTIAATATNTYAATGVAQIKAKKVVLRSGQETAPDANAFMFMLNGKKDDSSDTYDEGVATAKNDGNGDVTFKKLVYTTDDAGKSFTYRIKEYDDGGDAYDFDHRAYLAKVTVTDKGDGALDCKVQYSADDGKTWTDTVPVFKNDTVTKMPLSGEAGFDGLMAAGGAVLVLSALAWIRRRRHNGEA